VANRSSRHESLATYRRRSSVGPIERELELYQPRTIPLGIVASRHRVMGHERLDLLAQRYFSDPLQYWRIADANPADAPEDLLEPGLTLDIPEP
jgi:hypothetical protein